MVYGGMRKGREMDRVRVIRVLEYVGPRDWVEQTLSKNVMKGSRTFNNGTCHIREAFLGDFPEIVEEEEKTRPAEHLTLEELKFMERFGWEINENMNPAIKYDNLTGKVLAHEGDETWTRDLKVAGE